MNAQERSRLVLKIPVRPPFRRFALKWIALLSMLSVGVFWTMLTTTKPEAQIPFSKFIGQVRAGNVEQVQITNDEIIGRFTIPVQWATESNTSTANEDSIYPAGSFSNFRVVLPRRLGTASSLDSLLVEHDVSRIAVSEPILWVISLLRYTLPYALLIITGIWILRQFPFKAQPVAVRGRH